MTPWHQSTQSELLRAHVRDHEAQHQAMKEHKEDHETHAQDHVRIHLATQALSAEIAKQSRQGRRITILCGLIFAGLIVHGITHILELPWWF